jgi:hypothetical protein
MALAVVAALMFAGQTLAQTADPPFPADGSVSGPATSDDPFAAATPFAADGPASYPVPAAAVEPEQIGADQPGTIDDITTVSDPISLIKAMSRGTRHVIITSHLNFTAVNQTADTRAALNPRLGTQVIRVRLAL